MCSESIQIALKQSVRNEVLTPRIGGARLKSPLRAKKKRGGKTSPLFHSRLNCRFNSPELAWDTAARRTRRSSEWESASRRLASARQARKEDLRTVHIRPSVSVRRTWAASASVRRPDHQTFHTAESASEPPGPASRLELPRAAASVAALTPGSRWRSTSPGLSPSA